MTSWLCGVIDGEQVVHAYFGRGDYPACSVIEHDPVHGLFVPPGVALDFGIRRECWVGKATDVTCPTCATQLVAQALKADR